MDVYLYGSSLVGGLQKYSDIDLFVVTNGATTLDEREKLIANLLQISGIYMRSTKRPIETISLIENGQWLGASLNVLLSNILCIAASWGGIVSAKLILKYCNH